MWTNNTLYIAFIAQVLFASWYMPRQIIKRTRNILLEYSADLYPKLYPVSKDVIEMGITTFSRINYFNVLVGMSIVFHGAFYQSDEMLNLDSSAVLLGFFLLQYLPFLLVELKGFKFLKLMRNANSNSTRKAELTPRSFWQGTPLAYKIILFVSHVAFILVIEYFNQHQFDGFGGYENLAILVFIDVFMLGIYSWNVYGKRKDPHLSSQDREKHNRKIAKIVVLTIVLVTMFASLNLIMSATDSRYFYDSALCIYFLILTMISLRSYRIDNVNFDVYKES